MKSNRVSLLPLLLVAACLSGCFPERHPFSPEELQTRRPKVLYTIPQKDGLAVDVNAKIEIWFDDLMQHESVEDAFSLRYPGGTIGSVADMTIHPDIPNDMLIVAGESGSYRAQSPGAVVQPNDSWFFLQNLAEYALRFIRFLPVDPRNIIGATASSVILSRDGGVTWNSYSSGLPAAVAITALACSPQQGQLWLGTDAGMFSSAIDEGVWQPTGALPSWTSARAIRAITADPNQTGIAYAATDGRFLYKTEDSGLSWVMLRNGLATTKIFDVLVHPQNSSLVYAATEAGFASSRDAGLSWIMHKTGFIDPRVRDIEFSPADAAHIYAVTVDGAYVSPDSGATWTKIYNSGTSTLTKIVAQPGSGALFVLSQTGVLRSRDNGVTWESHSQITSSSLEISGTLEFENWRGEQVVGPDSTVIKPYVYDQALKGWDGKSDPPVDPDPVATKIRFTPQNPLARHWQYVGVVGGSFESDRETLKARSGAKNIYGMSLEVDEIFELETGE